MKGQSAILYPEKEMGVYIGDIVHDKPHGKGKINYFTPKAQRQLRMYGSK
jgi:hypothetical protein